jgi:hypothetical protein
MGDKILWLAFFGWLLLGGAALILAGKAHAEGMAGQGAKPVNAIRIVPGGAPEPLRMAPPAFPSSLGMAAAMEREEPPITGTEEASANPIEAKPPAAKGPKRVLAPGIGN